MAELSAQLVAYIPNTWSAQQPITAQAMNHMEQGIQQVTSTVISDRSVLSIINTWMLEDAQPTIASLVTNVEQNSTDINTHGEEISRIQSILNPLRNEINNSHGGRDQTGTEIVYLTLTDRLFAMEDAIVAMRTEIDNTHTAEITSLGQRFAFVETKANSAKIDAENAFNAVLNATYPYNIGEFRQNLATRLYMIDGLTSSDQPRSTPMVNELTALQTEIAATHGNNEYNSITDRFQAIETITDEVVTARSTTVYGTSTNDGIQPFAYNSLDARLEAIENREKDVITEVNNTHINGVASNLSQRFANLDGNTTPARTLPSVITEINNAHRIGLVNANDEPIDDQLVTRFQDDESRIGALEGEITNAHRTQNDTLDDRFDADELRTTALETEIAAAHRTYDNWENDVAYATGDIVNYNNQFYIRTGETQEPLGENETYEWNANDWETYSWQDTLNTRFTDEETRITALEQEINAAHRIHYPNWENNIAYNTGDIVNYGGTIYQRTGEDQEELEENETYEWDSSDWEIYNDTLDDRFDSVETNVDTLLNANLDNRVSTLEAGVNQVIAVAEELSTANTRMDGIEENLIQVANEVGLVQNGAEIQDLATAWNDSATRIDALEDEVNAAHRTNYPNWANNVAYAQGTIVKHNNIIYVRTGTSQAELGENETYEWNSEDWTVYSDSLDTRFDDAEGRLTTLEGTSTNLTNRVGALETTIDTASTGLVARVSALESEPKSATVVIDNTCITYNEVNEQIIPTLYTTSEKTTTVTPTEDADYLLQGASPDTKYYYWKYIGTAPNGNWELISGGSGSGNSSAEVVASLESIDELDLNTDYYVGTESGQYIHYRFVEGENDTLTPIIISNYIDPTTINQYRMVVRDIPVTQGSEETAKWLYLYKFNLTESTDIDSDETFEGAGWTAREVDKIQLPTGGGGGNYANLKISRITPRAISTASGSSDPVNVQFFFTDGDYGETYRYSIKVNNRIVVPSSEQTQITSGDPANKATTWPSGTVPIGFYSINIRPYCTTVALNQKVEITITSEANENITASITWDLSVIDFRLTSEATDNMIVNVNDDVTISYIPYGAIDKVLHVVIDKGTQSELTLSTQELPPITSGRENSYTIEGHTLTHGAHTIEMYLTATIGTGTSTTDSIIRQYIWYDETDTETPVIIASQYSGRTIDASQYSTIEIPYQVYKKNASSIKVYYYLDGSSTAFSEITLEDTNTGILTYLATVSGSHTLTITVDNVSISINLTIRALDINIAPVNGAVIDFDPTMLTNSSTNRLPSWTVNDTTYELTASPNFNWSEDISGGGYKEDSDGKCFVIKAGSYVDLNYKMFETKNNKNVFDNGAEIKLIFKTTAVRDAEAVWFTNTGLYNNKTVGIQLGTHVGWLKTDKASNTSSEAADTIYDSWEENTVYAVGTIVKIGKTIYQCITSEGTNVPASLKDDEDAWDDYLKKWLKLGQVDTEVLSTNSYLYLPYSEKDKIELDININKYESGAANNFIMSYEDGVPSKAYAYTYGISGDGLTHANGIRIGSVDCDVYLYHLRIYNKALSTSEILQNFIADGKNIDEKVSRYNKNCIYWDSSQSKFFTSPSGTAILDPVKLAEQLPDVKILMLDTPRFTTGKKDFVKESTLRCIHAKGGKVYESRGDADNWFFQNGFHAGQGTTSDNYGQSARNVDFLFEVDATHWPTKEKNIKSAHTPNANYVSSVLVGENATKWDATTQTWIPTSIYDDQNDEWVPNTSILTEDELAAWTATVPDVCLDWKGDECKVDLTSNSIPNNYFNLKVNVASSENVNNALFQERYNEFLYNIDPSPAYKRDQKIKNDMEFVPAILFLRERGVDSQGNVVTRNEFNDDKWHFYALGNIGDSKKTDYTRAYNPKDMNEFTVENSDNNTNNGQFQSGVFVYQNHNAVETDYPAWSETTAYTTNSIVVYNGMVYTRTGADQAALGENETYSWTAADWTAITYTGWTDQDPPYFAPRTNPNPMDYIYPITPSQWNVKFGDDYLNRKHMTLVTEKFDGDHSFEFRYACMGDYRDGDLINDTTGLAKTQEKTNHQKVLDFYEWLVTATEEEYEDEAADWFVPEAMEYFYAFTHYYTMMDNRAKNTFWHWGKRYISTNDANGTNYNNAAAQATTAQTAYDEALAELASVEAVQNPIIAEAEADITAADAVLTEDPEDAEALAAKEEATATKNAATALVTAAQNTVSTAKSQLTTRILKRDELKFLYDHADCYTVDNTAAAINDGRRFDLWAYDMDTAAGIDNNGALVFPYGKEDEDYRVEGESSSGYAFNGAGSIFWRRLKNTFADGIRTVMNNANINCFNSEHLIEQFDRFQNCFPEEIWRLDIERKYIRTFTGASVDNSITTGKQNPRFLTSMMQGRKKYQRRQWIRNQGIYFNSKYRLTDIIRNENTIEFNIITPTDSNSLAVTPNYILKLTPYQDMYLNVQVGNGNYQDQIRAKAGVEYSMNLAKNTSGTFQETRIYINGFNSISGIGNLAPMYPYSFTLSALEHLKVLNLGTDNAGYRNANFTSIPFNENTQLPLLETLNIKNCNSLSGTINLNTANNIRTIEATGSAITGVILPDYVNIETLHLPSTVSAISLYGARFLNDFYMKNASGTEDYSALFTLHIYDSDYSSNINWINIALAMLQKESYETNLQLLRLSSATIGDIQTLEPISELKPIIEAGNGTSSGIIDLSGTINITGNWSTIERDYYGGTSTSVWPNLQFDTTNGTYQTKHKVTYRYDDYQDNEGNIISGATIKVLYINDGAVAPDIYANGTLSEMPHRDATVRHYYEFGAIDDFTSAYIPYSGWRRQGDTDSMYTNNITPIIREDTVIETWFDLQDRTYYVNWYLKRNTPSSLVKTSQAPVPYGGGYNLEAPTIAEIHAAGQDTCTVSVSNGSATYSIFTGWEKLPTNINPSATDETYNIYATWNTNTVVIDDLFATNNISNLTPEQLLVLSALDSNGKNTYGINSKIQEGTRVTYTLGQDSIATGIDLVGNNPLRFDGATDTSFAFNGELGRPSIQPLKAGNDAFTLAIDYCFNPNVTYESQYPFAVLASCYYGSTASGIRNGISLFYGTDTSTIKGPRVGFGDMYNYAAQSVVVGNSRTLGSRNVVVLRHPAGQGYIEVYSGLDSNITTPENVVVSTINWTNYNSDAYLNFGRLTNETTDSQDGTPQSVTNAKGTIFWAKYWNEDLGQGECKRLAAWPHEQTTFAISRLNSGITSTPRVSPTVAAGPSIYLSAMSLSTHARAVQSRITTLTLVNGRDNSVASRICNSRLFYALPTQIQAIMCKPSISYTAAEYNNNPNEPGYNIQQTATLNKDYVFQYSAANIIPYDASSANPSNKYGQIEDTYSRPFSWFNSTLVTPYTLSNNSWVVNGNDTTAVNYLNIRFPFKAIGWSQSNKMRVFRELTSALPSNTTIGATIANSTDGHVKSGDVYIDINNNTYVYVLQSEIQALGIQIMPNTGDYAKFGNTGVSTSDRGGWVAADGYWTRSVIATTQGVNFAYGTQYGTPNIETVNSASSLGYGLMYSIAI